MFKKIATGFYLASLTLIFLVWLLHAYIQYRVKEENVKWIKFDNVYVINNNLNWYCGVNFQRTASAINETLFSETRFYILTLMKLPTLDPKAYLCLNCVVHSDHYHEVTFEVVGLHPFADILPYSTIHKANLTHSIVAKTWQIYSSSILIISFLLH